MRLTFLLITAIALTACSNTFEGLKADSHRAGEKIQTIGTVITEP